MDTYVDITAQAIDVGDCILRLRSEKAGGTNIFLGSTRRWTNGLETVELEYDCYQPMARKEIQRLMNEASGRWPILSGVVVHRVGSVPAGEVSIFIGTATAHRADAFSVTRFLIDSIKNQVPIWKREVLSDGSKKWVEGTLPASPQTFTIAGS